MYVYHWRFKGYCDFLLLYSFLLCKRIGGLWERTRLIGDREPRLFALELYSIFGVKPTGRKCPPSYCINAFLLGARKKKKTITSLHLCTCWMWGWGSLNGGAQLNHPDVCKHLKGYWRSCFFHMLHYYSIFPFFCSSCLFSLVMIVLHGCLQYACVHFLLNYHKLAYRTPRITYI